LLLVEFFVTQFRWQERESACLSIGALGSCTLELNSRFPSTIDFLINQQKEKQPKLKSTSLWALSRHTVGIASQRSDALRVVLGVIEQGIRDPNKVVTQSACATLAVFAEDVKEVEC
jgi:hypothetical protein